MSIPTILTLGRIVLIPVFVICFYLPFKWSNELATLVFVLAAFTDWLDGYLARKLDQASPFGAFLDPVADKLMVTTALVVLVEANPDPMFAVPAAIIVGREIAISALREWMAEIGERAQVAVSQLGKWKTTAQMSALILLIFHDSVFGLPVFEAGVTLLYLSAVLTLWSMWLYLRAAWPVLRAES